MNTAEFLQISAMVVPERTALVCGDNRVTFAEMADRVNRLANWLQAQGAGPDPPVRAMSTNGIALSYINLSVYVTNTMSPADPDTPPDVTLLSVPIFHVAGVTPIMSSVWGGRTLVVLPQFDPKLWLEAVQKERVTHSFVVPTM